VPTPKGTEKQYIHQDFAILEATEQKLIFWGCLLALSHPTCTTDSQTPLIVLHIVWRLRLPNWEGKAAATTLHTQSLHQMFTTLEGQYEQPGCHGRDVAGWQSLPQYPSLL